jgi:alkyl sulfatase BDS1-like metallo-beta-lactamase superfamily hydrolase
MSSLYLCGPAFRRNFNSKRYRLIRRCPLGCSVVIPGKIMSGFQKHDLRVFCAALLFGLAACDSNPDNAGEPYDHNTEIDENGFHAATLSTERLNRHPDIEESDDFDLAMRGHISTEPDLEILNSSGEAIWNPAEYEFLNGDAPSSVDASLWRQARLNNIHGLFEVTPGIYQVRGYDLSNMSIIESETGRIIIDPLTSVETARAAMALVNRELGERPVHAIIFTHSHIDHFGGVSGVVDLEQIANGQVQLIAPSGFTEAAVSENVMAGIVMGRRSRYMYGMSLPRTPRGHVGSGLGKEPSLGSHAIAHPNLLISQTGEDLAVDGVRMVFQYAPETEAPAELTVFFPDFNAWCGAELVSRTMHNLYTPRGAQVRDALAWSSAIDEALTLFGDQTDVIFNSHHWPVWGRVDARNYLASQRDIYKYIHDQTLRLAASGLGPDEIADTIELPDELSDVFAVRGYYGTLKHNSRAVYQRYFGWYDGVPANLDAIPRTAAANRYVQVMGGLDITLDHARQAFERDDYRWAAELAQHAVFAAPNNAAARELLARSYEQMGYQAESGPWRDIYLSGAWELRHGVENFDTIVASSEMLNAIPLDLFFSAMATRLDGNRASGLSRRFNFVFRDVDETYLVEVSNGVMRHYRQAPADDVDATVELTQDFWFRLLQQEAGVLDMLASDEFSVTGDRVALLGFFALLDRPDPNFAIVTP